MGHGYPPWSGISKNTVFSLPIDMAELAARLGSIVTFDRRGDVIWLDSFQDGLVHVDPSGHDAPVATVLSSVRARTGAYSAKMVAGPGAENWGEIYTAVAYPAASNFGYEVSFTAHSDINYVQIFLGVVLDDVAYEGWIRYYPLTEVLQYRQSDGTYIEFGTGIDLSEDDHLFHTAKLVVDGSNYRYLRFLLDSHPYDLSAHDLYTQELVAQPAIVTYIRVVPIAGGSPTVYADDLIITQNEPGVRD